MIKDMEFKSHICIDYENLITDKYLIHECMINNLNFSLFVDKMNEIKNIYYDNIKEISNKISNLLILNELLVDKSIFNGMDWNRIKQLIIHNRKKKRLYEDISPENNTNLFIEDYQDKLASYCSGIIDYGNDLDDDHHHIRKDKCIVCATYCHEFMLCDHNIDHDKEIMNLKKKIQQLENLDDIYEKYEGIFKNVINYIVDTCLITYYIINKKDSTGKKRFIINNDYNNYLSIEDIYDNLEFEHAKNDFNDRK